MYILKLFADFCQKLSGKKTLINRKICRNETNHQSGRKIRRPMPRCSAGIKDSLLHTLPRHGPGPKPPRQQQKQAARLV
ncbi:MAG: hypothetical protein DU429_01680 [Candidatus Tokpelaia sp.]|nr:MAG: hypothetical protein DU430_03310 [Candidatus Tokpelaia sp.]KAA6207765.1 MAG: hypothetical protein DU429_01680 [Candidatus Tokpelaia sp.]